MRIVEHAETTLVFDYSAKIVELYTTSRLQFLRAIKRNPNFVSATSLDPGYSIEYPLSALKSPEACLRPAAGGDLIVQQYMTPVELAQRQASAERLRAVRYS